MDQEYLLTDEQYLALVQREFAEQQPPANEVMNRRIWERLQKKAKSSWTWSGIAAAAVVALCILIPYRQNKEPELKSGHDMIEISLSWASPGQLQVIGKNAAQFSLYGGSATGRPQRLSEAKAIKADETQTIPLDATQLKGLQKICVIAGATGEDLQNLEKMLDVVWTQLPDNQCQPL